MQVHRAAVFRIVILSLLLDLFQAQGQVAPLNVSKPRPGVDVTNADGGAKEDQLQAHLHHPDASGPTRGAGHAFAGNRSRRG
jgi:hypothetical protein